MKSNVEELDNEEDDVDDLDGGDGHNCAFFTLEMLVNTPNGVTSPITVTFLVSKSMLNDLTPARERTTLFTISTVATICFLSKFSQRINVKQSVNQ